MEPATDLTGNKATGGATTDAAGLDAELAGTSFLTDPYIAYDRLRSEDPVHWSEPWQCWVVSRYADVSRVLREDGRAFSTVGRISAALTTLSPEQRDQLPTVARHYSGGLLLSDPPDHTRLRTVVNRIFTPRRV